MSERGGGGPVRLILIGPDGSGKSAILVRYMTKKFIESYQSSCDVIYRHQIVVQENPIDVEILDTSSYERRGFSGLSACLDWADCFLVIYDVTMLDSAPRTRLFLELIRSVRGSERLPIVLIGNKTDMAHRGHVDKADMEILSSQFHCRHFLVSAAEDPKIVDLVFMGLAAEGQMICQSRRKAAAKSMSQQLPQQLPQQQQQQQQVQQKRAAFKQAGPSFTVLKDEDVLALESRTGSTGTVGTAVSGGGGQTSV